MISNKLNLGDTIGIIAPSNPVCPDDLDAINNSKTLIESAGFKVEFAPNLYKNSFGFSATPQEKVEDIHYMFSNPNIKAIFCAKGGSNSNSLFEYLDYDLIQNNPKILCGFSDSTSLTNIISYKTELVTFNGPTFKSLTSWETDYGYNEVIKRFVQSNLNLGIEDDEYITIRPGICKGKLIGGNLSLISQMICGKYSLNFDNKILFLEETGHEADPARVSSYFSYMKQNGVFEKINGLWLGNYTHESNITIEKILIDTLENNINVPIIKSNNFGHIDKKTVIPIGSMAEINTNNIVKIKLIEDCVK